METNAQLQPERQPPPPEIVVQGIHKSFGRNHVLRGVNLEILQGELVMIVGGSGSGKTVLLEHMIGHFHPDRGRVLVANHGKSGAPLTDLGGLDELELDEIRLHWAVVFQRNALFSGSVYDNIAFWLREHKRLPEREIRPLALEALQAVGFRDAEELLDRDREALSGGMAKRVAIARALAMNPVIMFYDEPTTGLDPRSAGHIHELIADTHYRTKADGKHQTTVIVTHDKDLLRRLSARIIMLYEGEVFFDGTFAEFEQSDSDIIRPYHEAMPGLHGRRTMS